MPKNQMVDLTNVAVTPGKLTKPFIIWFLCSRVSDADVLHILINVYWERREISLGIRSKRQVCIGMEVSQSDLTLSLPRVPSIKIQDKSQISFCKILKYK